MNETTEREITLNDTETKKGLPDEEKASVIPSTDTECNTNTEGTDYQNSGIGVIDSIACIPKALSSGDFLLHRFPEKENMIGKVLKIPSLSMIFATRGLGKTHFVLNLSYAIAMGKPFLGWEASTPLKVLYVDGEMQGTDMQERVKSLEKTYGEDESDNFHLMTPDLQEPDFIMPKLATKEGQEQINQFLINSSCKLIVIDNISTLCHTGNENNADDWDIVQTWLVALRSQGRSVILVHHTSKSGNQRGTAKREDVLDNSISLEHSSNHEANQGVNFELHFKKNRGATGDDVRPLKISMSIEDNVYQWQSELLEDNLYTRVVKLWNTTDISQADIAKDLNINRSTVSRHIKKARENSDLTRETHH